MQTQTQEESLGASSKEVQFCAPSFITLLSSLESLCPSCACVLGRSAHHPRCLVEARYDGQAPGVPYRTRDSVMD